jgi:hypothetical protein
MLRIAIIASRPVARYQTNTRSAVRNVTTSSPRRRSDGRRPGELLIFLQPIALQSYGRVGGPPVNYFQPSSGGLFVKAVAAALITLKTKEMMMISRMQDAYGALPGDDAAVSGVSWGAVIAGAVAAAALSFILIILGFGLGFSAISPWTGSGASAQIIGVSTILWVAFTQIAASAVGGYMAGRLRVKWASVHGDEVYFRDTAHGFLAWAVASLATAALLTSAIGGVLSGGAKLAGATGATAMHAGMAGMSGMSGMGMSGSDGMSNPNASSGYFIDTLFRPNPNPGAAAPSADSGGANGTAAANVAPNAAMTGALAVNPADNGAGYPGRAAPDPAQRAEVTRIFVNALRNGGLSNPDRTYIAQIVARRDGISQDEAEKRVADTYAAYSKAIADAENNARVAAEKARRAAAYGALWMFVALLCGAFVASLCATFGGRLRDRALLVETAPGNA